MAASSTTRLSYKYSPVTAKGDLGLAGFSLQAERAAVGVEFDHAVALRILDAIGEYGCALGPPRGLGAQVGQPLAEKDVVAQDQRRRINGDEVAPDRERLRQPVGARLLGTADRQADPLTVTLPRAGVMRNARPIAACESSDLLGR